MPAKDRAHLKKLEDPKIYEGGMDLLVQVSDCPYILVSLRLCRVFA
ncbi:unnamed protein product [Cuscuta europaea]|uniref:Uncharacterized protein n=1 Tax=Cuscuta europaea TaxID=41803 RepID=A0A9P1E393_CUSEU|nr:unnamed protein product [Cuscuta europaea]